jgi:vitamin B12 transporter
MKSSLSTGHRTALICAIFSALSGAASCHAQSNTLDAIVVSASRTTQRVQDALPATTLITRTDIDAAQLADLPGLLRRVAGVEITQNGGQGTLASVFIRGAESRHTLLLIDGVPVNNLNFGLAALEQVPLDNVERVEIVRGNVSALYGSAAIGGVIQVFTRQGTAAPAASVSVQAGSNAYRLLGATLNTPLGGSMRLNATLESLDSAGFNATRQSELPGTNPDRDGYTRHAASLALVQDLGRLGGGAQSSSLGLRLRDTRGSTRYDSQYGPATQPDVAQYAERGAVLDARFMVGAGLNLNAALTRSEDRLNASETAYPYWVNSSSTGSQLGLDWQMAPGQRVTAGYDSTHQQIDSDTVYARSSRQQDSLRLGYQADYAQSQVQLNLRQDKYSDFGSANTYYAGYAWRATPQWRVNASLSSGFNAPTFNDLYYPWGGNAALRPERVKSGELGLQYAANGQELRAVLFHNRYRDLIGNDANYSRVNVDAARNQGLELSYSGSVGKTRVQASATSQDPTDVATGQRLTLRAATLGHLGLGRDYGAWSVDVDLRYNGARPDGSRTLASYAVLDLSGQYSISRELKATARVQNLLDREFETVYGYRQAARSLLLGLNWQPGL